MNSNKNKYLPESYALINLDAIKHNYAAIKKWTGVEVLPVLKANAYGHGLEQVAKTLYDCGAKSFAVANFLEAKRLRTILPDCDVLVFGNVNPSSFKLAINFKICLTVFSGEYWSALKQNLNQKTDVQIKINTGFNRLGFDIDPDNLDKTIEIISEISSNKFINITGIYSHLRLVDLKSDRTQYYNFCEFIKKLEDNNIDCGKKHIADSISAIDYDWCRMNMVRVGAALFGLRNDRTCYDKIKLKPALKVYSSISQIRTVSANNGIGYDEDFVLEKNTKVATIAIGYGDGYPRQCSNKSSVMIKDEPANIISSICMDQCTADVTNITDIQPNDKVLVLDSDYRSPCSVKNIAKLCNTNQNSIVAGLAHRLSRIYINS